MFAPADALSIPTQLGMFVAAFVAVAIPAIRAFLSAYRAPDHAEHVILEQAEIADMRLVRQLATQMAPALEKLSEIDERTKRIELEVRESKEIVAGLDREMEITRRVREELAKRQHRD